MPTAHSRAANPQHVESENAAHTCKGMGSQLGKWILLFCILRLAPVGKELWAIQFSRRTKRAHLPMSSSPFFIAMDGFPPRIRYGRSGWHRGIHFWKTSIHSHDTKKLARHSFGNLLRLGCFWSFGGSHSRGRFLAELSTIHRKHVIDIFKKWIEHGIAEHIAIGTTCPN